MRRIPGPIQVSESIAAGVEPGPDGLEPLARAGIRAILDLRPQAPPGEDKQRARLAGLDYRHAALDWNHPEPGPFDRARRRLAGLPHPVYLHGDSPEHAALFGTIDHAIRNGHTGRQALARAARLCVAPAAAEIRRFVRAYVDYHDAADEPGPGTSLAQNVALEPGMEAEPTAGAERSVRLTAGARPSKRPWSRTGAQVREWKGGGDHWRDEASRRELDLREAARPVWIPGPDLEPPAELPERPLPLPARSAPRRRRT